MTRRESILELLEELTKSLDSRSAQDQEKTQELIDFYQSALNDLDAAVEDFEDDWEEQKN